MGCDIWKDKDGQATKIVCNRGRLRCRWCSQLSTQLCDFVMPNGTTCDAPMCKGHAIKRGTNVDFCPDHAEAKEIPA